MQIGEIVGADQPDQADMGEAPLERGHGIDRIAGAQNRLHRGDPNPPIPDQRLGVTLSGGECGHAVVGFERVLRGNQPPDAVKPQPVQRLTADLHMALMGRIERAAEQAHPGRRAGIQAELGQPIQGQPIQGRTCPSPWTTYL